MEKIPANIRLARAEKFLNEVVALPNELFNNGTLDKGSEYSGKVEKKQILFTEIRSFLKLCYGEESEYFQALHTIKFTFEEKGLVVSNDHETNKLWKQGKGELFSLVSHVIYEERERVKLEELMIDRTLPLRYTGFAAGFVICMIAIWAAPVDLLSSAFTASTLFAARVALSIGFALLLMIVVAKEKWKELLFSGIIAVATALFPFLKVNSDTPSSHSTNDTIVSPQKVPVDSLERFKGESLKKAVQL